jgi:hypothetical protein
MRPTIQPTWASVRDAYRAASDETLAELAVEDREWNDQWNDGQKTPGYHWGDAERAAWRAATAVFSNRFSECPPAAMFAAAMFAAQRAGADNQRAEALGRFANAAASAAFAAGRGYRLGRSGAL